MKYLVIPTKNGDLKKYRQHGADSFVFGLQNYSVNYPELSFQEIVKLSKEYSIWVSLNKNVQNGELQELENLLEQLSLIKIEGILFYDLAILGIVRRKKLKVQLVWHQTHMVTNYQTCNYYFDHGVSYGIVSNEITLEEILEMKQKTDMKLMVQVVGYPVMSHSRRKLVQNYFKSCGGQKKNGIYTLTEKGDNSLFIRESPVGTTLLFGKPINGTKPLYELLENGVDYAILDMTFLEDSVGIRILELYQEIRSTYSNDSQKEKQRKVNYSIDLLGNFTNFFYKKTIYKVK